MNEAYIVEERACAPRAVCSRDSVTIYPHMQTCMQKPSAHEQADEHTSAHICLHKYTGIHPTHTCKSIIHTLYHIHICTHPGPSYTCTIHTHINTHTYVHVHTPHTTYMHIHAPHTYTYYIYMWSHIPHAHAHHTCLHTTYKYTGACAESFLKVFWDL